MVLTLMLAAGLLAAPEPQAEPRKGWVVEIHGFSKHPNQAELPKEEGWTIEVRGYSYHLKHTQPTKGFIIEFKWKPRPEPVKAQYQPVKSTYHDDLSALWKQFKVQIQVETVEAFYVDDLRASYKQLKKP
jgi:hypothetical protein